MSGETFTKDYAFHFINDIEDPFVQLISIGRQKRADKSYYYDNREREASYLFQYTLGGSGTLEIGGERYIVGRGQAFFLRFPGNTAYFFDEGNNEEWEFLYVLFRGKEIERYYRYIVSRMGNIMKLSEYQPVIREMEFLFDEVKQGRLTDPFVLSGKVFGLVCLLCSFHPGTGSDTVEQAKRFMQGHCQEGIGIAETARHLKISRSHLSRIFLREAGQKPVDYLAKARIEKSVGYLVGTDKSIDEIAMLCGFSCGNYFSKVFVKHMHISPGRFRANAKNEGYLRVQV